VGIVTGRIVGPEGLQLLRVPRETGVERQMPIERRDGKDGLSIRRVEVDGLPWLVVGTVPVNRQRVDVSVRVPADAPPGPFAGIVRVVLDDPDEPLITFPVVGVITPRVLVEPGLVRPSGAPGRATVTVRGGRLLAARFEPEDAGVATAFTPGVGDGAPGHVELSWTTAPKAGQLVLTTDVKGEEQVVVPFEP
jgi:hypothetical protein